MILTANVDGAAECCSNLWVEFNHEITFIRNLIIAFLALSRYPFAELITNERVDHVDDPLAWQFIEVSFFGQVLLDLLKLVAVRDNLCAAERIVHWHMQVLRILRFDNYTYVGEADRYLLFFSPRTMSLRK